ncbi:MAG: hypothetical protein GTO40_03825, partial [Deltaproteobacteria bacterium]|nr:hypothetical protein [Deltaproteobacteria bacterium]
MISPFVLHQPESIEAAASLLGQHGGDAKLLAGGSELILLFKLGLAKSSQVINLKKVSGLSDIHFDSGRQVLQVGALVTHRWIEQSPVVKDHFPLLVQMEQTLANVRIRNVGTLVGNLCFAEPHADPGTVLLAHGARVNACSARGERSLDLADFFIDDYQTALAEDEIATRVEIHKLPQNYRAAFLRFCPAERPMANAAIAVGWQEGVATDVRIALGCVDSKPFRATAVENELKGKNARELTEAAVEVADAAARSCNPTEDLWGSVEYKRQIVKALVADGLSRVSRETTSHG